MSYRLAGVPHEISQKLKLFRSKPDFISAHGYQTSIEINVEVAGVKDLDFRALGPGVSELGTNSCQQFIHAKRLSDVIIRTGVQRLNLHAILPAHRQYDN